MVIAYLEKSVPESIPADYWPPSSPDLNSLDYGIWSELKRKVYSVKINDKEQLQRRIRKFWKEIPQELINKIIDRFRSRVSKMLSVDGRCFEYLLK